MSDTGNTIVVFGATGRQGGSVLDALLDAGRPVRVIVRDPASPGAVGLRARGVDVVKAGLDDTRTIRALLEGTAGVFLVLPGNLPDGDEVRFGTAVADAVAASGVGHLVYSSGASAGEALTGIPRFDAKPLIESHVRKLPIATTIVRPTIFMEMLLRPEFASADGRFQFLAHPERAMQLVAVRDIGRIVAAIFADRSRFTGQTLRLASDAVSGRDLEAALSEALGRTIGYARFSDAFLASRPDLAWMVESLDTGPLSQHADLTLMHELNPNLQSLRGWLAGVGESALRGLTA